MSLRTWATLVSALGTVVVAGAVVLAGWPAAWAVNALIGGGCLTWGLVVLTLPWDLHFQAREVLAELERSRAAGLEPKIDAARIARIARRTLLGALALHVVTAIVVAAFAALTRWPEGFWVAGAYLASSGFRPLGAWYVHVRATLRRTLGEVHHPREDAAELRARVVVLEARLTDLVDTVDRLRADHERTREELVAADTRSDRRLDAVARKFDESLDQLTDNREVVAGLRAFLRLVRAEPA